MLIILFSDNTNLVSIIFNIFNWLSTLYITNFPLLLVPHSLLTWLWLISYTCLPSHYGLLFTGLRLWLVPIQATSTGAPSFSLFHRRCWGSLHSSPLTPTIGFLSTWIPPLLFGLCHVIKLFPCVVSLNHSHWTLTPNDKLSLYKDTLLILLNS